MHDLAAAWVSDTNVKVDVRRAPSGSTPTATLLGPTGRSLDMPLDGARPREAASAWFDRVVSSPVRETLVAELPRRFCLVILAESGNAEANARARREIESALTKLSGVFDHMPKDVGRPPRLLAIAAEEREAERVLLWSLGLEPGASSEPQAAVVFGRGRRVGQPLRGAGITGDSVFGILANAGQSCECGLDRSWMRGPRVPLRWSDATREQAAKLLGFDPDSPLVKTEVTSILARGPGGARPAGQTSVEELLLGYREEVVGEAPDLSIPSDEPGKGGDSSLFGNAVAALLAILLVSVIGAVAIIVRSSNR
jgi:hypothetical protein